MVLRRLRAPLAAAVGKSLDVGGNFDYAGDRRTIIAFNTNPKYLSQGVDTSSNRSPTPRNPPFI
ncbi:hypothetical protein QUB37_28510 [Microcoleus sp. AT3-A2]